MDFDTNNTTPQREAITFSATGSEYFRIWIVNLLLPSSSSSQSTRCERELFRWWTTIMVFPLGDG